MEKHEFLPSFPCACEGLYSSNRTSNHKEHNMILKVFDRGVTGHSQHAIHREPL
jgi:hypothetical protein